MRQSFSYNNLMESVDRANKIVGFCKEHNMTLLQFRRLTRLSEEELISFIEKDDDYSAYEKIEKLFYIFNVSMYAK